MRKGTNDLEEYTTEYEMSHIPFELNHLVSNERFSISGFPSLYMGSSVYFSLAILQSLLPNIIS